MIKIPFTKLQVSWHFFALLVVFMLLTQSWWRGLVAFAAMFCGLWLLAELFWVLILVFGEGKKRHPGESWRTFSARVQRENAASRESRESSRYDWLMNYRFVKLDCGHIVHVTATKQFPEVGERFWCWGHRKFGPAQEQRVLQSSLVYPSGDDKMVLW